MPLIKTLIFDFGDVFINLDKLGAIQNALELFGISELEPDMLNVNVKFEIGAISSTAFISFYKNKYPNLTSQTIINAWNYILRDFPEYRLQWLQNLAKQKQYQLILLSNTNALHIKYIKTNVSFYNEFKACFDAFYLSHEIHLRKPNIEVFEFVLHSNNLAANTCLFIDDTKENIIAANQMGIHTWHIDNTQDDVINLFEIKKTYF